LRKKTESGGTERSTVGEKVPVCRKDGSEKKGKPTFFDVKGPNTRPPYGTLGSREVENRGRTLLFFREFSRKKTSRRGGGGKKLKQNTVFIG